MRLVRIGVIGNAALDDSGNVTGPARLATLVRRAGAETAFAGLIEDGPAGAAVLRTLRAEGIDVSRMEASGSPVIRMGDPIDIAGLFAMDSVVIAVSDLKLHRFLVDLPVHTSPNARLIGLLSSLAAHSRPEAIEIALLHDLVIATSGEIEALTGAAGEEAAIGEMQRRMSGANLRTAAILGRDGAFLIVEKSERFTGNGTSFDEFAAAVVVAFAKRAPWTDFVASAAES